MLRRTLLKSAAAAAFVLSSGSLGRVFAAAGDDALLAPWPGPNGGTPPWGSFTAADFPAALRKGMDMARAEFAAIAANPEAPTFENTMVAFENAARPLNNTRRLYGIYQVSMNDETMQAVGNEMDPILAGFDDEVTQNEALFARIKAIYDARATLGLNAEQIRLVETYYEGAVRYGAAIDAASKVRLAEINQELAKLFAAFNQNMLKDEEEQTIVLESAADLDGVPESMTAAYAAAATERGHAGKWLISNTRSSVEPFLVFATRRDLREKAWRMFIMRGDTDNGNNNKATIAAILKARQERAKLLGHPTHAHWSLSYNMAKTPEAAMDLMTRVWAAATARVREEVADMQAVADGEGAGIKIEAWDYRFYAEKVRKAKYDIDENALKPYLQMDKLREAVFWASGQVYGLEYVKVDNVPVYHPDMTVYEVRRNGQHQGYWYFDPYARAGKESGAWQYPYRTQERFAGERTPIASNNCNYVKAAAGEPVLISWDDAETLFHEFGHGLHELLSNVTYPTLAGTNTKRDFIEFPSQVNEYWLTTPEVLNTFAVHYQTGQPIPAELLGKLEKSKYFNQGFATVEYLASALYDMKIHMSDASAGIDAGQFEKDLMAELNCPAEIVMRHRPTQFGHAFGSDSYAAGYYAYMWADTLTSDAAEAFVEAGSFYDKATCQRLEESIMSVGNSIPPDEAFRRFRGRDVDTNAIMRDRGFPVI